MYALSRSEAVEVVTAITEGMSIRATARMFRHHHDTVGRLLLRVGEGCVALHDQLVRGIQAGRIEVDEA